ncbi:CREG1 [Sergentomyia squamirostris]
MIKFQVIVMLVTLVVSGIQARGLLDSRYSTLFGNNGLNDDYSSELDAPPYKEYAKMARYLVHELDWSPMGTISTLKGIKGFPMVNVISIADSARGEKSTGRIFFYLTDLDFTGIDLKSSNRLTALFSMEQNRFCSDNHTDAMEPTCARIMISGKANQLKEGSEDYIFAKRAMLSRHPAAQKWIETHNFYLCEIVIDQICVLDFYGGPHFVTPEDYYRADPESLYAKRRVKYETEPLLENGEDDDVDRPPHRRHHRKSLRIHVRPREVDDVFIDF